MKLGDVLRKERTKRELTTAEVAERLGLTTSEWEEIEAGDSPAEEWGPRLAQLAIQLETPTSRLLAPSGRFADTEPGQAGRLIRQHRETRELDAKKVAEAAGMSAAEYEKLEAGESELEKYGPLFLGFAETIEQPVFNLFYPCGLDYRELDDYP
ncbi:MAG TPA: helix-turn-helix transcriptional regulator [Thermoanaerobaculia bacterium]|nr:helix-turn-helix transcriptional regulator [Thermoanaerobaculia bacterium]